jgi:hypothetical protein
MAVRWAVVSLGIRMPLSVAVRSRMAELSGVAVPMPTFCCAFACRNNTQIRAPIMIDLDFMLFVLLVKNASILFTDKYNDSVTTPLPGARQPQIRTYLVGYYWVYLECISKVWNAPHP